MKAFVMLLGALFVLSACAATPPSKRAKVEAYCKTHAKKVTLSGSPDVESVFRDCAELEGIHEIEVREAE
ncbi:MAG: hypothetical protein C0617_04230 [Desulfuromonas sp.]|uniref:hypothetical protein n=1 Tax=Desulfuromonas sp. TaxID=892 RepID=UPI000CCB3B7D|nr:hypothetical protein [Desulfuromonas sp.]PLX85508.1 MAG: hypothetical protein C0617_04230 [Desulfuromonas sp.]